MTSLDALTAPEAIVMVPVALAQPRIDAAHAELEGLRHELVEAEAALAAAQAEADDELRRAAAASLGSIVARVAAEAGGPAVTAGTPPPALFTPRPAPSAPSEDRRWRSQRSLRDVVLPLLLVIVVVVLVLALVG